MIDNFYIFLVMFTQKKNICSMAKVNLTIKVLSCIQKNLLQTLKKQKNNVILLFMPI